MKKTRVLLVQPVVNGEARNIFIPPLSLVCLAAYLDKHGCEVRICDLNFDKDLSALEQAVIEFAPHIAGLTFNSSQIKDASLCAACIKKLDPSILVTAGGAHPTAEPEWTLRDTTVDCAVIGEGEGPMLEIAQSFARDADWRRWIGQVYRCAYRETDGTVVKTKIEGFLEGSQIPVISYKYLPTIRKYLRIIQPFPVLSPSVTISTSRGCPGACVFCQPLSRDLFGSTVRHRPVADVVDEIEETVRTYGVKSIQFVDDTFTASKEWVMDFTRTVIDRKLRFDWICGARVDSVDKEMLSAMRKAGCVSASFGVESGSPAIRKRLGKPIAEDAILRVFRECRETGIIGIANFMVGNLNETNEDVEMSRALIERLECDQIRVSITTPLPGSGLWKIAKKKGLLKNEDFDIHFDRRQVVMNNISDEEAQTQSKVLWDAFMAGQSIFRIIREAPYFLVFMLRYCWNIVFFSLRYRENLRVVKRRLLWYIPSLDRRLYRLMSTTKFEKQFRSYHKDNQIKMLKEDGVIKEG